MPAVHIKAGPLRGLEGPRVNTKCGAHNKGCVRGVWGHTPRKLRVNML